MAEREVKKFEKLYKMLMKYLTYYKDCLKEIIELIKTEFGKYIKHIQV